ncbi:ABC transporter ATP-binding protein [Desulfoferrobacter suflitae]|jgi:putative ABC transport system ATP-binding protein|uniref:ABC transporter ATP-binding protein n=1 Tax=Desulfoferrobacter suflitae TaxID=2865782 RepID=UPI0021643D2E|nr:ABC transporter ATP-binding protein [Desulfoferrobacter suflitae]MCK8604214.1 ABC transporter ATP-binding protein [Desulfoferrobacter suflitae]MDY0042369.1 ABC transporter ATP-binding protein [Desulforhabdus sp.]
MNDLIIRTEKLTKIYEDGYRTVALQDIDLTIARGSLSCIMGPSGHGKSTLLHLIGGLDRPTSGRVYLEDMDLTSVGSSKLAVLRCRRIGFVFQFFNLLPVLTVLENVEVSMMLAGVPQKEQRERAIEILRLVGLEEKCHVKPNQLSGGQRQRVAIARAMANNPDILLMDEPTGNLDSKSEQELLTHIHKVNQNGKTIVIVTHSQMVAAVAQRIFLIRDGRLENS